MLQPRSVSVLVFITVANAVALSPTKTERLPGYTAAAGAGKSPNENRSKRLPPFSLEISLEI